MKKNRSEKLIHNSIIFGIGSIGSKLIGFLLLPLYTTYLSTIEYGQIDLITIFANLLLPIASLCMYEGILRFTLDKDAEPDKLFASGLLITISVCIVIIICACLAYEKTQNSLILFTIGIVSIQVLQNFIAQFIRGIGHIKVYSLNGFLMGIILALGNVVCIVFLNMGIVGYMIAWIGSYLLSVIFLLFYCPIRALFHSANYDKQIMKKLISYSFPLVLNVILMWIITVSNRLFIYYLEGEATNGIFAISNKLPMMLETFYIFFFQAWQLSAIEEFSEADRTEYFSKVFQVLSFALFSLLSLIVMWIKPLMTIFIGESFYVAWKYVPVLLLSIVFSCFSSFIGTVYNASKKNIGMFVSTLIGAGIALLLSFLFVPKWGMLGAGMSSCFTMIIIWLYRIRDTNKVCPVRYSASFFPTLAAVTLQVIIVTADIPNSFLFSIFIFGCIIIINHKTLLIILSKVKTLLAGFAK